MATFTINHVEVNKTTAKHEAKELMIDDRCKRRSVEKVHSGSPTFLTERWVTLL